MTADPTMRRFRRPPLWTMGAALLVVLLAILARPALHLARTERADRATIRPTPSGHADDVSRLNRTAVHEVWRFPGAEEKEAQLAALLARAEREDLRVSIAGARHSMGGHTLYPGGIVVDMRPFHDMRLDGNGVLHVQSGALWSEVIAYLDPRGRSVAVMQSDADFTVGGSLSVNAHGWQHDRAPVASTVRAFRLMRADGRVVRCSRTENAELFGLVLGGYGLFGIILDVELETVPNERYREERHVFAADEYPAMLARHVTGRTDAGMAYGRISVAPSRFLNEAILTVYRRAPSPDGRVPPMHPPAVDGIARTVFRGEVGSDYGKELRWAAERRLGGSLRGRFVCRNELMNARVALYSGREDSMTEVIHEYFVAPERVPALLSRLRRIVPRHGADLLNVTVRTVRDDPDTFLRYARGETVALVFLFSMPRTEAADLRMQALTREMIDAALAEGGTYYLPYRLHASDEQFLRAYPQAPRFFALKRKYDPRERFQSRFYERYGAVGRRQPTHP